MNETQTPEQLLGAGFLGLFCCVVAGAGFIGVLIWMFRQPKTTTAAPPVRPPMPQQPAAPVNDFHLSVMALSFDAYFRPQVEALLTAASAAMDPVSARVELVQRVARALLGVAPQWRYFGYGEKDLVDLAQAQESYGTALADFRARSTLPSDGGNLAVLTLVLCTRGRRAGVDRLDTRTQIDELLHDRLKLDARSLLGAEVIWGPPQGGLSEPTVRERFPEMHVIVQ